jgi:hypothetical protein
MQRLAKPSSVELGGGSRSKGSSVAANPNAARHRLSVDIHPRALDHIVAGLEPRWGKFLRLWQALADDAGGIPPRSAIDPANLGKVLLPNIFLVDVVHEHDVAEPRFRFRLLGQEIIERESTRVGAYLDQFRAGYQVAEMQRQYRDCVAGKVWLRTASLAWNDKDFMEYQVLLLPLSEDSRTVTHLIGLALYQI